MKSGKSDSLHRKQSELAERKKRQRSEAPPTKPRSRSEKREAKRSTFAKELDSLRREESIVRKIKKGKVHSPEVVEFLEQHPNVKAIFRKKKH